MVEWASDDRVPTRAQLAAYSSAATVTSQQETGGGGLNMATLKDDYQEAMKRMRAEYVGPAEGPPRPGDLRVSTQSIAARIANLAQQVTSAADLLDEARVRHRTAAEHRAKCEAMFAKAREELVRAMDEHGDGPAPENVQGQP